MKEHVKTTNKVSDNSKSNTNEDSINTKVEGQITDDKIYLFSDDIEIGMSKDEVKRREHRNLISDEMEDNKNVVYYEYNYENEYGLKESALYTFNSKNKLEQKTYFCELPNGTKKDYLSEYLTIRDEICAKIGKTQIDYAKNMKFSGEENDLFIKTANNFNFSTDYYFFQSDWVTDNEIVLIILREDENNGRIELSKVNLKKDV